MHRASYCNVYICRTIRCTNSYNVPLFIIKCSTCFGLFSPSSGCCVLITTQQPDVPAYTNCDIQLQNFAPDDGLKSAKHVERLMINKDTLISICASSWYTYISHSCIPNCLPTSNAYISSSVGAQTYTVFTYMTYLY